MKQRTNEFIKGILAGIMIAIGASTYLYLENHYVGAVLFTIGLYTIYTLDFYLFTGKVGFLLEDRDPVKLLVIWLGNLVGTVSVALLLGLTRLSDSHIVADAVHYAEIKIGDNLLSVFILGCFCGLMMYIAAKSYRIAVNTHNAVGGYVGLFLCVMVFLLLGFEHSVANMFYFTLAGAWSMDGVIALLVVTMGNTVGALMPTLIMMPVRDTAHA